jgi:ppGpp synthetase/RelA/SpoT-type nucleotidyltranferase
MTESALLPEDEASSPEEWGDKYRAHWRLYDAFSERLRSLLEELLKAAGIVAVQVDARAKDVESFIDKLEKKPGRYENPLVDITDLAGVRVIVYYASDVERVDALIEREFLIDADNSWKRTPTADPDRFGYRSDHYVVSCSESRSRLGEWSPYQDLKAEIQVRTVLQHAWAAIDHRLSYKRSSEIPTELKRQLFRISALLEVADDQFESVRIAAGHLSTSYEQSVSAGKLTVPVDRASVEIYVDHSPQTQYWTNVASSVGFRMEPGPRHTDSEIDDDRRGIGALTRASQSSGFTDLDELDRFLHGAQVWGENALSTVIGSTDGGEWYMSPAFIMASIVLIGSDLNSDELATASDGEPFFVEALMKARAARPTT